jgi:RNA polymerase sigma factor (sigma-70 family)
MQCANESQFKDAIENEYYKKIMYKVCNENLKGVCTKDEMKSIMMSTLWGCIQKFDSSKKVKFSSYLYRSMQNNSRRVYKKKSKYFKDHEYIENFHGLLKVDNDAKNEARDILMSVQDVNPELHKILVQKFYYGMTNKEIGEVNGYGKEAARKKLKKALELCRELCIV